MYTELSRTREAVGKTVQSVTYSLLSDQILIAFTDETFMALGIEHGYEDDDSVVRKVLDLEDFGRRALVESGIIAEEEFNQKMDTLGEKRRRAREKAERWQYMRLKAKFGGHDDS